MSDPNQHIPALEVFLFDLYRGQPLMLDEITKSYFQCAPSPIKTWEIKMHNFPAGQRTSISSNKKPWSAWAKSVEEFANEIIECLRNSGTGSSGGRQRDVLLSGKAPLSMFLYLGYLINSPLKIVNEFRGDFQSFDIQRRVEPGIHGNKLQLTEFNSAYEATSEKLAILFVTLDPKYWLSDDNRSAIQSAMQENGRDCDDSGYFRMAPARPGNSLLPLKPCGFEPSDEWCLIEDLQVDVLNAYEQIKLRYKGLIVITTGPQPLAYVVGMLYKPNLYGELYLFEMAMDGKYRLAYPSQHE